MQTCLLILCSEICAGKSNKSSKSEGESYGRKSCYYNWKNSGYQNFSIRKFILIENHSEVKMKKITTKQLTITALLLAICLISQYFKNLSVYITGPIINAILIIAVLSAGLYSGILLAIIAPITAFFFTGSPLMAAIPLMFPTIMLGNLVIVLFTYIFQNKMTFKYHLATGLVLGSLVKAVVLGVLVAFILIPAFGSNVADKLPKPEMLPKVLATAKITFSIIQLSTAMIGSAYAMIIWLPLKHVLKNEID